MCISGTVRYLLVLLGSLRASRALFEKLTYTVLRTPLRWLDTVPVGRILNRFTYDELVPNFLLTKADKLLKCRLCSR